MEDFMLKKVAVSNFSDVYPRINKFIIVNGDIVESRNGVCREVLDFSTTILEPRKRCVGVLGRNMNIFFLIAEAMWITAGRKDVEWLDIFNSNMKNYSDDGIEFHAPYGFRLRHFGHFTCCGNERQIMPSFDQVAETIRVLTNDPNSRQAVMSIWNPHFDLGYKSKDLPCNDMVMLKVRNKKMFMTIANRSNDLHLGLTTNLFQFSFLGEVISSCLGIDLGTQTHNSQSLHVYVDMNDIWKKVMIDTFDEDYETIYDYAEPMKMDFNFSNSVPVNRLFELDYYFNIIFNNIIKIYAGGKYDENEIKSIKDFSSFLYLCFNLLKVYVTYKLDLSKGVIGKDVLIDRALEQLSNIDFQKSDFVIMAKNFFEARRTEKNVDCIIGKL